MIRNPSLIDIFPCLKNITFLGFTILFVALTGCAIHHAGMEMEQWLNRTQMMMSSISAIIVITTIAIHQNEDHAASLLDVFFEHSSTPFLSLMILSLWLFINPPSLLQNIHPLVRASIGWNSGMMGLAAIVIFWCTRDHGPLKRILRRFYLLRLMRGIEPNIDDKTWWIDGMGIMFHTHSSAHEQLKQLKMEGNLKKTANIPRWIQYKGPYAPWDIHGTCIQYDGRLGVFLSKNHVNLFLYPPAPVQPIFNEQYLVVILQRPRCWIKKKEILS